MWNCSVPHWPDFHRHLLCNLVRECAGGEDEMDCSYTPCGTHNHSVEFAGACYSLHRSLAGVTWREADINCSQLGARLVSFNTPEEWNYVTQTLRVDWLARDQYKTLVGLRPLRFNQFMCVYGLPYRRLGALCPQKL